MHTSCYAPPITLAQLAHAAILDWWTHLSCHCQLDSRSMMHCSFELFASKGFVCEVDLEYLSFGLAWWRRWGEESLKSPPDRRQLAFVWQHGKAAHVREERLISDWLTWGDVQWKGCYLSLCDWWRAPGALGMGWAHYIPLAQEWQSEGNNTGDECMVNIKGKWAKIKP